MAYGIVHYFIYDITGFKLELKQNKNKSIFP